MRSTAFALAIGLALGVTAGIPPDAHAQSPASSTDVLAALAARPNGTAQRAAFYDAAARADLRAIAALETQAAALDEPETREFALGALLQRHAEIDPQSALAAATRLAMQSSTVGKLYATWLATAPAQALEALDALDDRRAAEIGYAVLAEIGADELLVNRVLGVMPASAADSLLATALQRVAVTSPDEAFDRAREIFDPAARDNALRNVISVWAERDPLAALERIDALNDEALRRSLGFIAIPALVRRDATAALNYLANLDAAGQRAATEGGAWQQLAATLPERVLERVANLPAEYRPQIELAALEALARTDPQATIERLARTPPGSMRQQLLYSVAQSYGALDPDGALTWARSLQPPDPAAVAHVISGLASADPQRAFDLAMTLTGPYEKSQAVGMIVNATMNRDAQASRTLLERVLALPNDADRPFMLQATFGAWNAAAPAESMEWLLANLDAVPADVVTQTASNQAWADPARAAAVADRLPDSSRAAWLSGVAGAYGNKDPRGAFEWLERQRGRPEYDDVAFAVLQSAAQHDPASAARVLDSISRPELRRGGIMAIAQNYASMDPAAAATWVEGQSDLDTRQMGIGIVAGIWAGTRSRGNAELGDEPAIRNAARHAALLALANSRRGAIRSTRRYSRRSARSRVEAAAFK